MTRWRPEKSHMIWFQHYGVWPPKGMLVDHKNQDRNDNRIENLRLATYSQNGYNSSRAKPHGYKGITYDHTRSKPWRAQIRIEGKRINLGRFDTAEEAAEVYREAAIAHHGEFVNHE